MSNLATLRAEAQRCYESGDVEGALARYEQLRQRQPRDAEVLNDLATVCLALGRWQLGERYYREALQLDPHHATAKHNLAALRSP